jgi:hypothetical protein
MKSNVHFNNLNTKNVTELYLYYRLRKFASVRGGWYKGFVFTKNEKYKVLPKLVKLGFVLENSERVVKYRHILNRSNCVSVFCDIEDTHLDTLDAFKGFLVASAESYILRRRCNIIEGKSYSFDKRSDSYEKNYWNKATIVNHKIYDIKKISFSEFGHDLYLGRAFNTELCSLMSVDRSTLSRWRNFSKLYKFNKYYYSVIKTDAKSENKRANFIQSRKPLTGSYSEKYKGKVIKDLVIKTQKIITYVDIHASREMENIILPALCQTY